MKLSIVATLTFLASLAAALQLEAQTYNIPAERIGPGGTGSGGIYTLSSSVGQWGAGHTSGGNLSLDGGFLALPSTVSPPIQYTLVDLGVTAGEPRCVNTAGQIVGYSYTYINGNGYPRATFWPNAGSGPFPLSTLGGDSSSAYSVNDSGQMVGSADLAGDSVNHAASWADGSATPLDLGSFGGASAAFGLNRAGQIVGYSSTPTNWSRPVFWLNASSAPLELGTFGGIYNSANSINDSGQIVGSLSFPGGGSPHAVFWPNSTSAPLDLGTDGLDSSLAWAINDSGQIVGSTEGTTVAFLRRPLYWPSGTSAPVRLSTLSDYYTSAAVGINASGQIVGYSTRAPVPDVRAILWNDSRSAAADLNTFIPPTSGWLLQYATAINDAGEIVGTGTIAGETHAFALIPSAGVLRITTVVRSGGGLQLSFTTRTGHTYNVLATANLSSGTWSAVQTGITGTGATVLVTIPSAFSQPQQFYRIQQMP